MVSSRVNLDDGRNNLLRVLSRGDSMAPLRSRDASCRQSFMNVRPMSFPHVDVSGNGESQKPVEASSKDNVMYRKNTINAQFRAKLYERGNIL